MNKWIDIGINLTNKRFDSDRKQQIQDANACGVDKLIITGTNMKESNAAYQLTKASPDSLFSTAGCHPHDADQFSDSDYNKLKKLLEKQNVVAIGECGLDFNRNYSSQKNQLDVFEKHLKLAAEIEKPLFLHERDAFDQQYALLKRYQDKIKGAVVHCFTGTKYELLAYLNLGFFIGITGWICDERRGKLLKEIVNLIPDDKLMLETDAPYLLPRDLRPKPKDNRNLPKFLPHIAQAVADARKTSLASLSMQCYANTSRFFRI